ncbi:hypothetical protein [Streptomyces zaomyceticus]|uniref:hypothetical protein n=1 Tax=Streptomyces zaomyceticus TaxID=68286 RepID=UPI0016758C63|nr:hypothetical protein [Streptomyces zaomyceticus]
MAAYTLQHLADRYGRVTQVLEALFAAGNLPIRQRGLTVLEVGAGPAPALYAIRDFYADLISWAAAATPDVRIAPVVVADALDRGKAWSHLLHNLSENILVRRGEKYSHSGSLPFAVRHLDLNGFSTIAEHVRELEQEVARIVDEYDRGDDYISESLAREQAQSDGVRQPSAYDLIVTCNFLTSRDSVEAFKVEISNLARSLTPGGLFVAIGSFEGNKYKYIWSELEKLLKRSSLVRLPLFGDPVRANGDVDWAHAIRAQQGEMLREFEAQGVLPICEPIYGSDEPFPEFKVLVWKNSNPPQKGRKRKI